MHAICLLELGDWFKLWGLCGRPLDGPPCPDARGQACRAQGQRANGLLSRWAGMHASVQACRAGLAGPGGLGLFSESESELHERVQTAWRRSLGRSLASLTADSDNRRKLRRCHQVRDGALSHPVAQRDGEEGLHRDFATGPLDRRDCALRSSVQQPMRERRHSGQRGLRLKLGAPRASLLAAYLQLPHSIGSSSRSRPPALFFSPSSPSPWQRPVPLSACSDAAPPGPCCPGPPASTCGHVGGVARGCSHPAEPPGQPCGAGGVRKAGGRMQRIPVPPAPGKEGACSTLGAGPLLLCRHPAWNPCNSCVFMGGGSGFGRPVPSKSTPCWCHVSHLIRVHQASSP